MQQLCSYCCALTYSQVPRCTLTDDYCVCVRRCNQVMWWVPIETPNASMSHCKIKERREYMKPKDGYHVRFCKKNILFVEVEDYVVEIPNIYDTIPSYVNIVKKDGKWVLKDTVKEKSDEPKKATKDK